MLIVLSTRAAVPNPTRRDCISLRDKHFEQFPSLYLGAYLGARTQRGIIVSARQRQPLSSGGGRASLVSFFSSTSCVSLDTRPNLCEYNAAQRVAIPRHTIHDTIECNVINGNEANITRNLDDFDLITGITLPVHHGYEDRRKDAFAALAIRIRD